MRPRTIGLLVNPKSGLGAQYNLDTASAVVQALNAEHVITGPGELGGDAVSNATILRVTTSCGRAASQAVARAAAKAGIEALAVIGGDGTMADVAFALYQDGVRCPILGIGAGSVNAGNLITCKAAQVQELTTADFMIETEDALEATCNNTIFALAFNDIVIGTTVVGTIAGEFVDLDANAFLNGNQVVSKPRPVRSDGATVTKCLVTDDKQEREIVVSSGAIIGTVVVGFAHNDHFFGKAIIGGVGLTSLADIAAGCLVCDQALVRTQLDRGDHLNLEPIRSSFVSLADDEMITVTGLGYPAVLCADGNPLRQLQPSDITQIRVRPGAVDVIRITHRN